MARATSAKSAKIVQSSGASQRALARAGRVWSNWLKAHHIAAARFQQQSWRAFQDGSSGIISAPTGSGKTLAALGGPIIDALSRRESRDGSNSAEGVELLWITPLRALATDTRERLLGPVKELLPEWQIALRTGDVTAHDRRLSESGKAKLLITTPESLAILLSHERSREHFAPLRCVVVDEWHELLPSKRGVLLQLNLARLRTLAPKVQVWGLSATIGNLEDALRVLVRQRPASQMRVVRDERAKPFHLHTILPPPSSRLPWAGHLGLSNLGEVAKLVLSTSSSIIFTNTRSQAELWFTALNAIWPHAREDLAIHHGSLDQHVRRQVEDGLRAGLLRCVVATSSLDLGVDFPAVDRVIQVGGARSVARMVQRAGRAKHRPGAAVHIDAVATQTMDLCEFAATRELAQSGVYERRSSMKLCLDVLSQHVMSTALAGGFRADVLRNEVVSTAAFEALSDEQWDDVIAFLTRGSASLAAYPQYERLQRDEDGVYRPANVQVTRRHRLGIGTIVASGAVQVQYLRGARLGSVEESFLARLSPGDVFNFAGRSLQLVTVDNMTAWVRRSSAIGTLTPTWGGSLMAMSASVGGRMQALLSQAVALGDEREDGEVLKTLTPEMRYLRPTLQLQQQRSHVPSEAQLLIELLQAKTRLKGSGARESGDGAQQMPMGSLFIYPFAGRVAHEGLAMLFAARLAQMRANTFSWSCNDIGLMLQAEHPIDASTIDWQRVLSPERLAEDLESAVHFSELARKRFKEIAQIAGLVTTRTPGARVPNRQLQVSAGLLYDVLSKYDPEHVLLRQARQEALDLELHMPTLNECLTRLARLTRVLVSPERHTPFSFGLWAESFRGNLTNESWTERVRRLAVQNDEDDLTTSIRSTARKRK